MFIETECEITERARHEHVMLDGGSAIIPHVAVINISSPRGTI